MQKSDGMYYAPVSAFAQERAVEAGTFRFAAIGLSHGHIYGMCNGLREAGATLKTVYEPDAALLAPFLRAFPEAKAVADEREILEDPDIRLVASAAIPAERTPLGVRVLESGKHYFCDKPGMLSFAQLAAAKDAVARTGKKFYIYFSERLHVEGAVFAQRLIDQGAVGRVLQVTMLAPHRLNAPDRPGWFFDPLRSGGILNDIGSHQFEQFLSYTGARTARVLHSKQANYASKRFHGFADFGDACLLADNGATGYCRVDWFTPGGLRAWGDGRVFVMGEKGTIEVRKYLDVAGALEGDHVILVDAGGETRYNAAGKIGFPFFAAFVRDCLEGTERSMTQAHVFESMRVALEACEKAVWVEQ